MDQKGGSWQQLPLTLFGSQMGEVLSCLFKDRIIKSFGVGLRIPHNQCSQMSLIQGRQPLLVLREFLKPVRVNLSKGKAGHSNTHL